MKTCLYCGQEKPLSEFYTDRRGMRSARCRRCHGLEHRICVICGTSFVGKPGTKACSAGCHSAFRPRTFRICAQCGQSFGPLNRLDKRYCSIQCKVAAQTTGRRTIRKTIAKARKAQRLVQYYLATGFLIRPPACEACGATGRMIEAAHHDYDHPLRVRWLCCACHRRWDKLEPKNGTFVVASQEFTGTTVSVEQFTGKKALRIAATDAVEVPA